MDRYVFKSANYRVQLTVIDQTLPETPRALRTARPTFCVWRLPAAANRYTAFRCGEQLYYGDDPDGAWDCVCGSVPDPSSQCPRALLAYMLRWSKR